MSSRQPFQHRLHGPMPPWVWPVLVLLVGSLVTGWLGWRLHSYQQERNQIRFERATLRVATAVESHLTRSLYLLRGVAGLLDAQPQMSDGAFQQFVSARNLPDEFPGLRGVGIAWREDAERVIVRHVAPQALSDNATLAGTDLCATPAWCESLRWSVRQQRYSALPWSPLFASDATATGTLLVWPIYTPGMPTFTPEQRQAAFRGVIFGVIHLYHALVVDLDQALDRDVHLDLYDTAAGQPARLLTHTEITGMRNDESRPGRLARDEAIAIGNTPLLLRMRSTAALDQSPNHTLLVLLIVAGALLTLVMALLVGMLGHSRQRAQRRAEALTQDLARLAAVAERTTNTVIITGLDGRVQWVNDAAVSLTGYAREELLGRKPGEVLQCPETDPATVQRISEALRRRQGCRAEVLNRSKDGRLYWLDLDIQPMKDAAGQPTGFLAVESDITESKRLLAELQAAEQRQREVMDATTDWTWETDREHVFQRFESASAQRWQNLHDSALHRKRWNIPHIRLLSGNWDEHRALLDAHKPFRGLEYAVERPGEPVVFYSISGSPFFDVFGQFLGYRGSGRDITERKARENQLAANEARLRAIYELIPVGLMLTDPQGRVVECNRAAERLLGVSRAAMLGGQTTGPWQAYQEDGTPLAAQDHASERARHSGQAVVNAVIRMDTGTGQVWLSINAMPVDHPDYGVLVTYTDISPIKASQVAQEQLAWERGERIKENVCLSRVLEALQDDTRPLAELAQTLADLIPPGWMTPDDTCARVALGGASACSAGFAETDWRQSETIWLDGEAVGTLEVFRRHNTPQPHCPQPFLAEEHALLQHIAGQVAQALSRRLALDALHAARAVAEAASVAKTQFVANMSHEIRTPMNAVLGMLSLLGRTPLSPQQQDYAQKAEGAARSLLGILNDILDFSKVEAGKMELDPQPVVVDELLQDLSVIFSASLGHKPVELIYQVAPDTPACIVADRLRLQQVLINLGGNAIKFTEQGEVTLSIERLPRRLGAHLESATLRFRVQDTGIGISEEQQARIFAGFSQAESSTTRRFGGTGLGLAISQRLVQLMGGELRVDSTPGQGTAFEFVLELPTVENAVSPPPGRSLRVLVADDHPAARDAVASCGRSLGWQVSEASSGDEAVSLARRGLQEGHPFDVICIDRSMPPIGGQPLWVACAAPEVLAPGAVVVLLCGQGEHILLHAETGGDPHAVSGVIVKPVTRIALRESVEAALRHASQAGRSAPATRPETPIAPRRLEGLRLLLVEDNPINRQVASELLTAEGARVSVAVNGALGVDRVMQHRAQGDPFDLVLMDVQMPVMDGYAATQALRSDGRFQSLPVVAMTANAMDSDRADALASGMNDHIGKPFRLDELVATIRRWCPSGNDHQPDVNAGDFPMPSGDLPWIDADGALDRLSGQVDLWQRLLRDALTPVGDDIQAWRDDIARGDTTSARRRMHTLKGVAATVGAMRLSEQARMLETWDAQSNPSATEAALQALDSTLRQTWHAWQRHPLNATTASPPEPGGRVAQGEADDQERALAQRLVQALQQSDMDATRWVQALTDLSHPKRERWEGVAHCVARMDFAGALEQIRQIDASLLA